MAQKTIGRFEIRDELGEGGMGTVYLAYDPFLEREVALKVLQPQLFMHDPEYAARFEREVKTIAALEHGSIVSLYEYGQDGEWHYFVMRLMRGGSLRDRLDDGPLSLEDTNQIVQRIGNALAKAHRQGLVHRDLKPANILFDEDGDAYLSDFGIVKAEDTIGLKTRTDQTLGTPHYMSPEQIDGKPLDGRSDIYSLGIILYEMLTGSKPYDHESTARVIVMHLTAPLPDILADNPDLPAQLPEIIQKAMAKEPAQRFFTVNQFAKELQSVTKAKADSATAVPTRSDETQPEPEIITPPIPNTKPAITVETKKEPEKPTTASKRATTPPPQQTTQKKKAGLPIWAYALAGIGLVVVIILVISIITSQPEEVLQPREIPAVVTVTEVVEEVVTEVVEVEAPADIDFEPLSVRADSCDYGGKILSIEAINPLTVVFNLCKTDPAFLAKVAFTPFSIQPSEWIAETGGTGEILEHPIGTGPYMVESWDRGDSIVFKRFDDYWGEPAFAETAVLRWATEGSTRLLELQAGTVDMITAPSPDDRAGIVADPNLQLLTYPNPNILYLAMNNTFEPFNDVNVRRAIAMGIDRQRIVDNFYPAGSTVPDYFTPCSIPNGCVGESWYEFDPEDGRALLAEAGYPDGFNSTLYYRDVFRSYLPEPSTVAVEIQTQLAENLGIDVEIVVMESGTFISESTSGNLDGFYLLGWGADYPHVTNFLDFHFGADNPQFGNPHPEIYEVLQEAATIADANIARPLYEQANSAIRDLVPMVPIANGAAADAAQADLGNAYAPPFGAVQFARLDPGDDTLVFMQNAEPISLYCPDETDGESLRPCYQVVETLYQYELDSGETFPALATDCTDNADSTIWTCNLREGVTFHDGSDFDANDVVASWAAGIDATNPYHVGNTGSFDYYSYLWDGLMNQQQE